MDNTFLQQVQDVLEHLHDYPYVQTHPLLAILVPDAEMAPRERMRALRACILSAINELNPGGDAPMRSPQARAYNVLNLRYVVGMTVDAVARELAVSDRQLYRDLRKAEQDLASLLWARRPEATNGNGAPPSREQIVMREIERISSTVDEVDVQSLVAGALAAVQRLSQQLAVRVETALPATPLLISTDRMLARQLLVSLLSHALQNAGDGDGLRVAVRRHGARALVQVCYRRVAPDVPILPAAVDSLLRRLDADWHVSSAGEPVSVTLTLGMRGQTSVLVIDDNEGLIELFRRYLEGENMRLVAAHNGRDGLRLADEVAPDVILLDVMMPQEDGWEVLQVLHNRESSKAIPVIVCSVLHDPQLALSLGAAGTLSKPVSRSQLLAALARYRPDSASRSHPTALADR